MKYDRFVGAFAAVAVLGILAVAPQAQTSKPVSIDLPPWNSVFKPGPQLRAAQANCLTCHSSDYVYMQPPLSKKQWTAEVNKMIKAYGAQIQPQDIDDIVTYLVSQNSLP